MTYTKAQEKLGAKDRRKLENNTYLERRGENIIAVKLHGTDVVTLHSDGRTVLNSGGWRTITTKDRINKYHGDIGGFHVHLVQEKSQWFVVVLNAAYDWDTAKRYIFKDGFTFSATGDVLDGEAVTEDSAKAERKLKRDVNRFVAEYMAELDAGNVPAPGPGDCFGCAIFPNKDAGHVLSHIKENYFVPSLLIRAIEKFPVSDAAKSWYLASFWDESTDERKKLLAREAGRVIGRRQLRRSLRRYIQRSIGLAA